MTEPRPSEMTTNAEPRTATAGPAISASGSITVPSVPASVSAPSAPFATKTKMQ